MENVSMENILNLYSNYLEDPQNVDLDYTMNLVMTINKYLSANLAFQTIYDDNAYQGFQNKTGIWIGSELRILKAIKYNKKAPQLRCFFYALFSS